MRGLSLHPLRRTPLVVVLGAVVLNLALIALALARYPSIFAAERIPVVVADVIVLLAYIVVALVIAKKVDGGAARALQRASWLGAFVAVIQAADITREYLVDVRPSLALISLGVVMLVTLAVFGVAGAQTKNAGAGALAGVWSAIVAMLLLWILAWVINYVLMGRLEQILVTDYDYLHGNTLRDLPAYTVWNTLSSAFSHAVLLPLLGAGSGSVGGAIAGRARGE